MSSHYYLYIIDNPSFFFCVGRRYVYWMADLGCWATALLLPWKSGVNGWCGKMNLLIHKWRSEINFFCSASFSITPSTFSGRPCIFFLDLLVSVPAGSCNSPVSRSRCCVRHWGMSLIYLACSRYQRKFLFRNIGCPYFVSPYLPRRSHVITLALRTTGSNIRAHAQNLWRDPVTVWQQGCREWTKSSMRLSAHRTERNGHWTFGQVDY